MKIVSTAARFLLGVMFTVFGLNGFFHFIPMPPPASPLAGQYMGAMAASNYLVPIFLIQVISGVLFLINRYVPLALTLIAPVIFNILLFHISMDPGGLMLALVALLCWIAVFFGARAAFAGILQSKPAEAIR